MSDGTSAPARGAWRLFWWVLALALLAATIMLLIDNEPQFFDGDSMVYLNSAFGSGGPGDRSFAYGRYFIRPLLWIFSSLHSVVAAEAIMAACCAAMLSAILYVGLGVNAWIAGMAGLVYVAEPLSILYQRMIMTEAPTLFFFALFLLVGVVYIRRPTLLLLACLAALSVACIAFRVSFLPALMASMVVLPPLALLRPARALRPMLVRCGLHLAVGLGLTFGMHALYKQLFHSVTGHAAAYNSADGIFLLASWSPLVTAADFPDPALFDRVAPPEKDLRNRFGRPGELFLPGGLIHNLVASQANDERAVNALAKQIAMNILRRDPLGVLALGWATYLDFWNPQIMDGVLQIDEGPQAPDKPVVDLFRQRYNEDIEPNHLTPTFAKWFHRNCTLWYRVVLLAPALWLAGLILRPRWWRPMLVVGISVISLMLVDTMLVVEPVVRYLHSIAWLTVLLIGVLAQALPDLIAWRRAPAPAV